MIHKIAQQGFTIIKNYPETKTLAGSKAETARLYRQNYALTYEGKFDHFDNKTYITFDKTKNSRLPEYLAGGPEGSYSSTSAFSDPFLKIRVLVQNSISHLPWVWIVC